MINARAYTAKMKKATRFNERRHPDIFDALNATLTTEAWNDAKVSQIIDTLGWLMDTRRMDISDIITICWFTGAKMKKFLESIYSRIETATGYECKELIYAELRK